MGAEAIRDLLKDLDLVAEAKSLRETIRTSKGQKQSRAIKRLKVVSAFITSENRPEWMILEAIPVIPPELRPMVQLDGGRFATSDLNDLYRRVINRNNRLKRLLDLGAPEIIVNNEKRMLQEAVDALFDNGRRGRAVTGPGNRALKSLSDMLKGKQGRFRQNLLGKRVDYSGRSVIVSGPKLKLHQCGLPKLMALELFKPFIMSRLVERKSVQNIKAAKKYVDSMAPEVWDVLEEVIAEHPVLLNRAPTLHRLGIQAFEPVLVEGKAIQMHPLVCHAFNADFDGDQMAVHLPLSAEAQAEARILMLSANNILSPAHGKPLTTPTQDMVLGTYYLTYCADGPQREDRRGARSAAEALRLRGRGHPRARGEADRAPGADRVPARRRDRADDAGPRDLQRGGRPLAGRRPRRALRRGRAAVHQPDARQEGDERLHLRPRRPLRGARDLVRARHDQGARLHATRPRPGSRSRRTTSSSPRTRRRSSREYEERVQRIERDYERGLITEDERKERIIEEWTEATDAVADAMQDTMYELNPIYMMANSGARGSIKQIRQLAGMRGLMANPKGEIIERPIKANFMEGLPVLEYFISTHGARKGLADTALRTADSGYLTRRLVDVSQDVIVRDEDCGTDESIELPLLTPDGLNRSLTGRILAQRREEAAQGREARQDGAPRRSELRVTNQRAAPDPRRARRVRGRLHGAGPLGAQVPERVRRVPPCYGIFLATGEMCEVGDAVGIIAAQSIGEPGTQLTMRTFHTGGVAGADITHGLPRVVEIFEARNPKGAARLAEVAGGRRHRGHRPRPEGHDRPDGARRERRAAPGQGVPAPAPLAAARGRGRHRGARATRSTRARSPRPTSSPCTRRRARARRRPSSTSSARCRRSTSRRASTSTTSTSS